MVVTFELSTLLMLMMMVVVVVMSDVVVSDGMGCCGKGLLVFV